MLHRKQYRISTWKHWAAEIDDAVQDFFSRTNEYPNVLQASTTTFNRINLAAALSKEHVGNLAGELPEDGQYADLTGLVGKDYHLWFAFGERLPDSTFALIYDDDPDDPDGEPWPEDDTVESSDKQRQHG